MTCSRRSFITGTSALIMSTGLAGTHIFGTQVQAETKIIDKKRYGMLHDETLCIGCTACTQACREVNQVPEGVTRLKIVRSEPIGIYPHVTYSFSRQSCQHCENPPCVYVCPTGAAFKDEKTGIVDVQNEKCVGCGYCLAACPYQVRFFNPVTQAADKCDFCKSTQLAEGKEPACVVSCPTKALTFGNLDDPHSAISKLLTQKTITRDKAYLGTAPQLYKVPHTKGEIKE